MKTAIIPTDSGRQSACSSATETGSEDDMPAEDLSDDEKLIEEKIKEGPVNDAQVQDIIELYSSVRDDSQRLNSQLLQLEDLLQNAFNVKIKQMSKGKFIFRARSFSSVQSARSNSYTVFSCSPILSRSNFCPQIPADFSCNHLE